MTDIDTDAIRARVDEFIKNSEILAMCDEIDRLRAVITKHEESSYCTEGFDD